MSALASTSPSTGAGPCAAQYAHLLVARADTLHASRSTPWHVSLTSPMSSWHAPLRLTLPWAASNVCPCPADDAYVRSGDHRAGCRRELTLTSTACSSSIE